MDDRWNSTSWDEFSRKWNKPVHTFLLRHVYAATILSYRLSKTSAMFLTFLLSACAHELVMMVVTRKIRMYLLILQVSSSCPRLRLPSPLTWHAISWSKYHSSWSAASLRSSRISWWVMLFSGWVYTPASLCFASPTLHIEHNLWMLNYLPNTRTEGGWRHMTPSSPL